MKYFDKVFDGIAVFRIKNSEILLELYFSLKNFSVWKMSKQIRFLPYSPVCDTSKFNH